MMRIKSSQNPPFFLIIILRKIFAPDKFLKFKILSILLVFLIAGVVGLKVLAQKGLLEKIDRNLADILRGVVLEPPQRMTIDIKFTYYQKLLDVRRAALAEGFLTSDEYVPAVITYRGKKANVQLRLKGDMANQHLAGEQWSFRVKVRGEDTLWG